jgi:hypothetical protein
MSIRDVYLTTRIMAGFACRFGSSIRRSFVNVAMAGYEL